MMECTIPLKMENRAIAPPDACIGLENYEGVMEHVQQFDLAVLLS